MNNATIRAKTVVYKCSATLMGGSNIYNLIELPRKIIFEKPYSFEKVAW